MSVVVIVIRDVEAVVDDEGNVITPATVNLQLTSDPAFPGPAASAEEKRNAPGSAKIGAVILAAITKLIESDVELEDILNTILSQATGTEVDKD